MWLSWSKTPFTYSFPSRTVLPLTGRDGHSSVYAKPNFSITASATGPILPRSVESKVEQYLKYRWRAPWSSSH